jgi:hypothetical protein|tara:strand:- start:15 stop:218 length:204 start_codon:yes stop_codon:yes gene_type:complete
MLEMIRPEAKAALTWVAVWLIALLALAMVPMDEPKYGFAAMPDEIHYSHGTNPALHGANAPAPRVQG